MTERAGKRRSSRYFSTMSVGSRVGTAAALTGPVERADEKTIQKHLNVLPPEEKEIYIRLSEVLTDIAKNGNIRNGITAVYPRYLKGMEK